MDTMKDLPTIMCGIGRSSMWSASISIEELTTPKQGYITYIGYFFFVHNGNVIQYNDSQPQFAMTREILEYMLPDMIEIFGSDIEIVEIPIAYIKI
jgi:hypothetical protein